MTRRLLWFILFALLFAWFGKDGKAQPRLVFVYVASDPSGACSNGTANQYNYTNNKEWGCENGTWTQVNTGGGGGGPTIAGTATQVTVTGAGCTGAGTCTLSLPTNVPTSAVEETNIGGTVTTNVLTFRWLGTLAAARMVNAGVFTGDCTTTFPNCTISAGAITLAKMANLAANSFIGNNAGSPATPLPLTISQSKSLLAIACADLTNAVSTCSSLNSPAFTGTPTAPTAAATTNNTQIATTQYVTTGITNALAGVNPAVAVQAATTAAGDTSALTYNNGVAGVGATFTGTNNTALTIDGFTFTALGQRLLVKNDTQSPSGAFNGIYYVTQVQALALPPILTRALDYDMPSDINNTGAIPVVNGTANALTSWLLTSTVNTVGTDPLTYTQFSISPTTSRSVFSGSTATNPAFSATPTFSLADVSVKSPLRIEPGALTANVTSVTFTNKTAGAKFSIAWTQDGTGGRTVAYGASANNTCPVDQTASATTTQEFEVGADGSTVNGTGCVTTSSPGTTNPQTSTYQVTASDFILGKTITVASGTFTITLVASTSQPAAGQFIRVVNYGSGVVTIARSGQNINGGTSSLTLPAASATAPSQATILSDSANYFASIGEVPASNSCTNQFVSAVNGTAAATCATVASSQMAVVNTRRTICIGVGANDGNALVASNLGPQSDQFFLDSPGTLVQVTVHSDAGTPNVIVGRDRAGSIVNLTSSALATGAAGIYACSNTGGTTGLDGATTCSATLQNTSLNAGDGFTLVSGTPGGTAKQMTACFTWTVS